MNAPGAASKLALEGCFGGLEKAVPGCADRHIDGWRTLCAQPLHPVGKQGHETVARVLPVGAITSANLSEVLYKAREFGYLHDLAGLAERLVRTGLQVVDVTADDAAVAAELIASSRKSRTPGKGSLSLGDGICIAVAARWKLVLVGDDRYWEAVDLSVEFWPFR